MKSKEWYYSKAMWSGIILIIIALYAMIANGAIETQSLANLFLGSGIVGVRQAVD